MTNLDLDVVVFDLDGTLADTAHDLGAALNHVLAAFDRPSLATDAVRHLVGHGARALIRKGLAATGGGSEEQVEQGMPLFLGFYEAHICEGTRPYDGVETALDNLSATGVALAICTNKPEGLTHKLLDALGWQHRFQAIVGGDTLTVRKPDPAPLHEAVARCGGGRAVFVGDSIIDVDTGRDAGIPTIAVSFGFSDRPADQLGADCVIHHYDQLIGALGAI